MNAATHQSRFEKALQERDEALRRDQEILQVAQEQRDRLFDDAGKAVMTAFLTVIRSDPFFDVATGDIQQGRCGQRGDERYGFEFTARSNRVTMTVRGETKIEGSSFGVVGHPKFLGAEATIIIDDSTLPRGKDGRRLVKFEGAFDGATFIVNSEAILSSIEEALRKKHDEPSSGISSPIDPFNTGRDRTMPAVGSTFS